MTVYAGVLPPAPRSLDDVGFVHAMDGDGTALCGATTTLDPIDEVSWDDVPDLQRCAGCQMFMEAAGGRRLQ